MIEADATFYFLTYKGKKLNNENAEHYLQEASFAVFEYTYGRSGRDNLTDFQIDRVMRAICTEAERLFEADTEVMANGKIKSYSADGVSITFADEDSSRIPEAVKKYLQPTGLINRTLY